MTSKIQSSMQKSKLDVNVFANFSAICMDTHTFYTDQH